MQVAAAVLVVAVAALHAYFLVLEMFLWQTPLGLRTFRMTKEAAAATAVLAGNQGLYNGFLAAGLVWGAVPYPTASGRRNFAFLLLCLPRARQLWGGARWPPPLLRQTLPASRGA